MSSNQLAKMIDHAVLRPDITVGNLESACSLVNRLGVASLCVRPCDVACAAELLHDSPTAVGTVIAFPHGTSHSSIKAAEAHLAIAHGAVELDMVVNVSGLLNGDLDYVRDDIAAVVSQAKGHIVKVILECCYLTTDAMAMGCKAAASAGATFVKTSTGFGPYGARAEDVRFMRKEVGNHLGVKAAGGISTASDALAMINAGADRIGTSHTEEILQQLESDIT